MKFGGKTRRPGANDIFKSSRIEQIFTPLEEYHANGKEFGYIVVMTPERIKSASSIQKEFQENGGMIVPLESSAVELFNAKNLEIHK